MSLNHFVKEIKDHTEECYKQIDVINAILAGELNMQEMRKIAKRHYAEIRTFLDVKIPERMRLCPSHAHAAKQYFWYLYREEHGFFKPGEDHADLFKPLCYSLGLSDQELEEEFNSYWPHYKYLFELTPSIEVLVQELAISAAWESFSPVVAPMIISALEKYGITDGFEYFTLHYEVDKRHGDQAYKTLNEYVTSADLQKIAMEAISKSLVEDNYFNLVL